MADNVFTRLKDKFQETDLYKSIYEATDGGDNYFNDNKNNCFLMRSSCL